MSGREYLISIILFETCTDVDQDVRVQWGTMGVGSNGYF